MTITRDAFDPTILGSHSKHVETCSTRPHCTGTPLYGWQAGSSHLTGMHSCHYSNGIDELIVISQLYFPRGMGTYLIRLLYYKTVTLLSFPSFIVITNKT